MSKQTHLTVPTRTVETQGVRFAYRRFGKPGAVPIVLNMHFTGTMDHWDPLVTDGLASEREVILLNNVGISSTSGEVPESIEEMDTVWRAIGARSKAEHVFEFEDELWARSKRQVADSELRSALHIKHVPPDLSLN